MGRDNESTPVPKRDYDMDDAADASPGSSSSSSFANVILPHRQCPGIEHLSRREIADIIASGIESGDASFIDEVANLHAAIREGRITSPKHRPKKRIRMKTSSDALDASICLSDNELLSSEERNGFAIPKWQVVKQARVRYACEKTKVRERKKGETYRDVYNAAYASWGDLSEAQRRKYISMYVDTEKHGTGRATNVLSFSTTPPEKDEDNGPQYSCGNLLTWNGPWFLDDAAYVALVKEWHDVPHLLVQYVLLYPGIREFFEEVKNLMIFIKEKFKLREWSCCLEISLEAIDLGRLHIHAFLERNCREDRAWSKWLYVTSCMKIRDVPVSHSVPAAVKTRGRNRCRALTEGHYYCQAEKIGQVINESTVPKFVKLFPDVRMVTSLWRHRKMTTAACKAEALLTRDKVPSTLTMLDATMALEYSAELERDAATADSVWKSCPFKEPTPGELEWLRQHVILASKPSMKMYRAAKYVSLEDAAMARNLRRYRFVIYDGPSRMGKTELACSWFGTNNTLVCNAQDCTTPNMRPILSGKYLAVLFDEGDWRLCYLNKTMMQASSRPVELGQSQCNDRSYQILLYKMPLIVCSNDFWAGCDNIAAREWIELNSIYIRIESEVWVRPAAAES